MKEDKIITVVKWCSRLIPLVIAILAVTAGSLWASPGADILRPAKLSFEEGKYPSAVETLRALLAGDGSNAELNHWLGRCYYELHDYDSAIEYARKSIAHDPRNSLYHQWLGRAYGGKARRERSLLLALKVQKEFEEAVRLSPTNTSARRDLEQLYLEAPWILDGADKARKIVEEIAKADEVEGHLAKAEFYLKGLGKPDLAEEEYRTVLDARPERTEPYFEIAAFYQSQRNGGRLAKAIENAAQVNPSDPRIAYYLGVAFIIAGDNLNAAEGYLKSYLADAPERSNWPSYATAIEWLGRLYEQEGRPEEAAEQYRAALQFDPTLKEARKRLGQLAKSSR